MHCGRILFLVGLSLGAVLPQTAYAQGGSEHRGGVFIQPISQRWEFKDPLAQDSLQVVSATQMSSTIAIVSPLGPSWAWEVSWGYARGAVQFLNGGEQKLEGPTDVRLRLYGPLVRDKLLLTLGYNGPTGASHLDDEQFSALGILASPALGFAIPVLGTGSGATGGLVFAQRLGDWSLATGAAYEYRGQFSPVEALIAGQKSVTNLDPGDAIHYSLGVDRLVGPHRVALMATTDLFSDDQLSFPRKNGDDVVAATYRLGRNYRLLAQFDVAAPRFRQFSFVTQWRQRSRFTDGSGQQVPGSNGTVLDAQLNTVLGSPRGFGLVAQFGKRHDSGLAIDNNIVTASMNSFVVLGGLSIPLGGAFLEPFARLERGTIDLGPQATTARGVSYGVRLAPR
jgi:hypothetical protein